MRNIIRIGAGTDGRNRFAAIALGVALAAGPAAMMPAAALAAPATDAATYTLNTAAEPSVKDFTADELREVRAAFAGFDGKYHSGAFDPAVTGYQIDDVKALLDVSIADGSHTTVAAGSYDEHGMPTKDAAKVRTRTYTVYGKESFVTSTYRFETRQPEAAFTDAELKDIESLFADDFKIPGFDPAITAYQMDDVDSLPLFWTGKPHIGVILTGLDGIGKPCYTPVENGTYVYTVTGKDSGSTRTYMVDQKPGTPAAPTTPSASDLSGVTATADGKPVKGFDPVAGGSWTVPAGAEVTIGNVPAGWTLDRKTTDGKLTFTVRNAPVAVVYTFIHQGEDSSTTQPRPPSRALRKERVTPAARRRARPTPRSPRTPRTTARPPARTRSPRPARAPARPSPWPDCSPWPGPPCSRPWPAPAAAMARTLTGP